MAKSCRGWYWHLGVASFVAMGGAIASIGDYAHAQVTPDGTLGAESSVVTPTNVNGLPGNQIDGGATRGANLFHSFEQFSVPNGGAASFNNALDIQNIITRVTGSSISNIDGLIRANASANLFLLNPNGINFGSNARLSIGGSFVGSTASSLNFADGTSFSATAPTTTPLLSVSVPIGLQYGGTAGGIQVRESILQVQTGQTLALMGGDVSVGGGRNGLLRALGGRVELGGVAGAGTVGLQVDGNNLSFSFPQEVQRANVSLTNRARVYVAASGGGSIAVNARNLNILGGSSLDAGIRQALGSVEPQAGDITLDATGTIRVADSNIFNNVGSSAVGNAGDINVTAGSLSVTNGAFLNASTDGQGDAGSVIINARDTASFDDVLTFSIVGSSAVGNAGDINITAGTLEVKNGAQLQSLTRGQGDAGSVTINARDTVTFDRGSAYSSVEAGAVGQGGNINIQAGSLTVNDAAILSAYTAGQGNAGNVFIQANDAVSLAGLGTVIFTNNLAPEARGNSGDISITARSLSLTGGPQLQTQTAGQGDAGNIFVQANDAVSLDDSVIFSSVESTGKGKGGDINITAGSLYMTGGAKLQAATAGQGNAGNVFIQANDAVSLDDSLIFSSVESTGKGNAGDINITAGTLEVKNGAQLRSLTSGQGDAGSVNIKARDTVTFDGVSIINDLNSSSAALSTVQFGAEGDGGDINITAGSLSVKNGARLNAATAGQGNAGSVTINADTVSFDGVGSNRLPSSALSNVEARIEGYAGGIGDAGGINITAGSLSVTNGAQLESRTRGQGNAGSVTIIADTVSFDGGKSDGRELGAYQEQNRDDPEQDIEQGLYTDGSYRWFSGAYSSVEESSSKGNGGNINITTGSLSVTDRAQLSARSRGNGTAGNIEVKEASSILLDNNASLIANTSTGQGGNIRLNSGDLVLRRGSNITTNATGTATGGNITIDTDNLVALENSDISANAQNARGGRVIIDAQGIFGTEYREDETSQSDITASSSLGREFSGIVDINNPDVDPSQGLVELPAEVVDVSNSIAQGCSAGVRSGETKFVITGRGGLPPNPNDPLTGDNVLTDWNTLDSDAENRFSAAPSSINSTKESTPTQIVEANGWMTNDKGEVILTATAPTATLNIPWLPKSDCNTPEQKS